MWRMPATIDWACKLTVKHAASVLRHRGYRETGVGVEVEVFLDWQQQCRRLGLLRYHADRGRESVTFEYADEWLASADGFAIDPSITTGAGYFPPTGGDRHVWHNRGFRSGHLGARAD